MNGSPWLIGRFGSQANRWKGDEAKYIAKHMWIYKHYGKANHCENDISHTSWRFEWANISGQYRRDIADWRQLCKACHAQFDLKTHCKHGHQFTLTNTRINPKDGRRICRACQYIYNRRYRGRNA